MTPAHAPSLATLWTDNRGGAATAILWVLVGAFYVYLCFRIAMHARKRGRSLVAWFLITLFFTAVPAAVMFIREWNRNRRAEGADDGGQDARKEGREDKRMGGREEGESLSDSSSSAPFTPSSPPVVLPSSPPGASTGEHENLSTCPHCGRLIGPDGPDTSTGAPACPHCGMFSDESHRA
ncbi:MAG: hypothetical protein ACE15C_04755 [Phycisphaerae bacterium]